ncbi:LAME_0G02366g1_1 [Lachancea meyersii CBS 8951]|uniref:LAME_0G02366g1_1 n=1 Tax=Lachancea meyersii CBS 8951 TaxID=1266667 RepID=A0A1G4K5Y2_9SACH|nr:LAME_0G02366g1_1 [Lachancea meyersii CBS 8951]
MSQLPSSAKKVRRFLQKQFPCSRVLAQRILKSTIHATVSLIFCLIPEIRDRLGNQPAMLPLIAVIVHPGRRVSATIQGAIYCTTGLLVGLAYALLGRVLAQKCLGSTWHSISEAQHYANSFVRYESALAVLAVFEVFMLFFHGWMRSVSHHYFGIVFPLFLVVHFAFNASLDQTAGTVAKAFSVPFYLGIGMALFWNLVLFPEFGSTYLGNSTVDALNEIHRSIDSALNFFISIDIKDSSKSLYKEEPISLARLLNMKKSIDSKVSSCDLILEECIYEISYSYVSPADLKPVIQSFSNLLKYINALINACQLEFLLVGRPNSGAENDTLDIKTDREIQYADAKKLFRVLRRMKDPIFTLHQTLSESLFMVKAALAYSYDVKLDKVQRPTLFSNSADEDALRKETIQDLDFSAVIENLQSAFIEFDLKAREELIHLESNLLQPNDEMFLFSSFLLNFKETTNAVATMMKQAHIIYQRRKLKESKGSLRGKTLWVNFLSNYESFKTWITGASKGNITESQSLNGGAIADNYRPPADMGIKRPLGEERALLSQRKTDVVNFAKKEALLPATNRVHGPSNSVSISGPGTLAEGPKNVIVRPVFSTVLIFCHDFYSKYRDHFRFGLQVTVALMLCSFPMFIPKTRHWYDKMRGTWFGFVCILALEPSVGGTFWVFFLRGVGVILGAAWAYVSYIAGCNQTNPYLEVVVTIFGAVPGFYYFLGTPYVKAAIIQIISIYVVMLAAIIPSANQGSILSNFAKRCLAVGYGGGIAVFVQVTMFPVTAREQLNGEVSFVAGCISEMQILLAAGLEGESLNSSLTEERYQRLAKISSSAKAALARASSYNGLTRQEPILRGEYTEVEKVFTQMIYIERQIIDRMDNIILLRRQYGSAIVEELNTMVYAYRRQYVASITSLMGAVQEAVRNKTPLPHFLPSARIAHRRLVNKVQSTLKVRYASQMSSLKPRTLFDPYTNSADKAEDDDALRVEPVSKRRASLPPHEYIMKEKFLSWNASSAASEEVIEYVEELVQLTKIVVGVNEFKYGFLSRPLYADWAAEAAVAFDKFIEQSEPAKEKTAGRAPRSPRQADHTSFTSVESANELDDGSSFEEHQPVAVDAASSSASEDSGQVSLARIASRKSEVPSLPSKFRKRAFSISYRGGTGGHLHPLSQAKTLGGSEMAEYAEVESDSDEELPLALKKMILNRRT